MLALVGCAGNTSVHTFGDTIDLNHFKGIVEINTDALPSGEITNDAMLRLNVEENIARALREKYKSMGSYSVFLITANKEELKKSNHRALRDRGYTHLLVSAMNPEKTHNGKHSMNISCTIYRLTDGMPVSLINTDVYAIDKNYWGHEATKRTGSISERRQLGAIYSCDQALKAATG